jgi:hypothetical protein
VNGQCQQLKVFLEESIAELGGPSEKAQAYIGAVQPYDATEVGTDARPQKAETLNHYA